MPLPRRRTASKSKPKPKLTRLPTDCDFSFLGALQPPPHEDSDWPDQVRRFAVLYEYSREAECVRDFVAKVRAYMETVGWVPEIALGMTEKSGIKGLLASELGALCQCPAFPEQSFRWVFDNSREDFLRTFRASKLCEIPWNFAVKMGKSAGRPEGAYVLHIPWERSNADLVKMFDNLLDTLRPPDKPEPTSGRGGRDLNVNFIQMLYDLGAYRLRELEVPRSHVKHLVGYDVDQRTWWRIIARAKKRIDDIATKALLG